MICLFHLIVVVVVVIDNVAVVVVDFSPPQLLHELELVLRLDA